MQWWRKGRGGRGLLLLHLGLLLLLGVLLLLLLLKEEARSIHVAL